ncbi:MAG: hypothetical protein NTU71_09855 [Verrucomicrobia bacterium]|jgi:hypothetical protein|nr:hypothetical protein [Verrucomicrobiota bacterium]MCX6921580.1 hypothetical protein [Verrucomicrobiota bacterium]
MSSPHPLSGTPPRSREQVAELHFMDARYKLLDLAAFLDRLERASGGDDHRIRGLRQALPLLLEKGDGRVAKILSLWSDPSAAPIEKSDTKAATGVWPGIK